MKVITLLVIFACAAVYQCSAQVKAKIPLILTGNTDGSVMITLGTGSAILSSNDFNAVKGIVVFAKQVFSDVTTATTQSYTVPVTSNNDGTVNVNLKGIKYTVSPAILATLLLQLQQSFAPFSG